MRSLAVEGVQWVRVRQASSAEFYIAFKRIPINHIVLDYLQLHQQTSNLYSLQFSPISHSFSTSSSSFASVKASQPCQLAKYQRIGNPKTFTKVSQQFWCRTFVEHFLWLLHSIYCLIYLLLLQNEFLSRLLNMKHNGRPSFFDKLGMLPSAFRSNTKLIYTPLCTALTIFISGVGFAYYNFYRARGKLFSIIIIIKGELFQNKSDVHDCCATVAQLTSHTLIVCGSIRATVVY